MCGHRRAAHHIVDAGKRPQAGGPTGAHDQMLLTVPAQNLQRRVRRLVPQPNTVPA